MHAGKQCTTINVAAIYQGANQKSVRGLARFRSMQVSRGARHLSGSALGIERDAASRTSFAFIGVQSTFGEDGADSQIGNRFGCLDNNGVSLCP